MYLEKDFSCLLDSVKNALLIAVFIFLLSFFSFAQSTDQNFPTPITNNQINGVIKARDIGDSRLTTFYYVFNGGRGDIFINVVTRNLNGDIDIFTARNYDSQTKITIYADNTDNETGRVIYLRKPEKLILRIQGRSPNDDAATFQIKFAGSFEAMEGVAENTENELPEVKSTNQSGIKVNSVGTIIEEAPKPTPKVKETVAEKTDEVKEVRVEEKDEEKDEETKVEETVAKTKTETKPEISSTFDPTKKVEDILREANSKNKPKVVVTDPLKKEEKIEETKPQNVTVEINDEPQETSAIVTIERVEEEEEDDDESIDTKTEEPVKTEETNPLAKIFLKVELKNGQKFERPMSEVLSMNIIKGVLTIVTTDGKIQEFSILDVLKTVIE